MKLIAPINQEGVRTNPERANSDENGPNKVHVLTLNQEQLASFVSERSRLFY